MSYEKHMKEYEDWQRKHEKCQCLIADNNGVAIGALYLTVNPDAPAAKVDVAWAAIQREASKCVARFSGALRHENPNSKKGE